MADRVENVEPILIAASGEQFFNTSKLDFKTLLAAPDDLADNLRHYIASFSTGARDVLDKFDFDSQIARLDRSNLLYLVVSQVRRDRPPPRQVVPNLEMGYLFEELIRQVLRAVERDRRRALHAPRGHPADGEPAVHRGRRPAHQARHRQDPLDPACGTGGMLSVAEDHLRELNPDARLEVYGQELNAETYAICRSDMMLKGQDASNIVYGNSFTEDGHAGRTVRLPPRQPAVRRRVEEGRRRRSATRPTTKGFAGRFGAGLPRINDGSLPVPPAHDLEDEAGRRGRLPARHRVQRLARCSPAPPARASREIRRWIIENDWLEAVVALPDQLFYNTGISTYFWVVTNRKTPRAAGQGAAHRRPRPVREDAQEPGREAQADQRRARSTRSPASTATSPRTTGSRSSPTRPSGSCASPSSARSASAGRSPTTPSPPSTPTRSSPSSTATDARPPSAPRWRRARGDVDGRRTQSPPSWSSRCSPTLGCQRQAARRRPSRTPSPSATPTPPGHRPKGNARTRPRPARQRERPAPRRPGHATKPTSTARLADRRVPDRRRRLLAAEVHPYVPDAWVDHAKTKVGYEIPLTRHFYKYVPPRPLAEIDAEIKQLEAEIQELLREVTE